MLNLKKGDSISVSSLESEFSDSLIGSKFLFENNAYGQTDVLSIKSKKKGFGILFFSENFQKEYYLDSHIRLKKED